MLRWALQTVRTAGGCNSLPARRKPISSMACRALSTRTRMTASTVSSPTTSISGHEDDAFAPSSSLQETVAASAASHGTPNSTPVAATTEVQGSALPHSMVKLRAVLSSDEPPTLSMSQIRHRYKLWKADSVLHNLSSRDMSSLISLAGTLSASTSGSLHSSPYAHPRAVHMFKATSPPQWDFIQWLGNDKCNLRYPLSSSDHYWLMRSCLARYWEHSQSATLMLVRAGKHYKNLCKGFVSSHTHALYLQALVASPTSESVRELVLAFVRLLEQRRTCDIPLVDALYRAILQRDEHIAASLKEVLLRAIEERVRGQVDTRLEVPSISRLPVNDSWDIDDLVAALGKAALGSRQAKEVNESISKWATTVAARVFCSSSDSTATLGLRWNCIVLLALARLHSTEGKAQAVEASPNKDQQAAVVEWRTVCYLATIGSLFSTSTEKEPIPSTVINGLSQVVRRVWADWTDLPALGPHPRPMLVTRVICATFLRLGGHLKDRALVEAAREYCVVAGLWSIRGSEGSVEAGLQSLATEQLYASLVCDTFFERALVDLMVQITHLRTLQEAVDTAISRYTRVDPEHAQELVAWATNRGVAPSPGIVAAVGVALARSGIGNFLDRYMNDTRLTLQLRVDVASAHLETYNRYGPSFLAPHDAARVIKDTFALVGQIEDLKRPILTLLCTSILTVVRHGLASQAITLVEEIAAQHPALVSAEFYDRLLRGLLEHRQFLLAERTLQHCSVRFPDKAQQWTSLVLATFSRAGAKTLASKLATDGAVSRKVYADLYRAARTLGADELVEMASSTVGGDPARDTHAWRYTLSMLVRAGRLATAKEFLTAIKDRVAPHVRTSLANTILHGHLLRQRSSDERRLRLVLAAHADLQARCGFVPDRVTVNVLIKAHLRSTTDVDAGRARKLFDALVRSGYPTGGVSPAQHTAEGQVGVIPPFGTDAGSVRDVLGGTDIPSVEGPLSYKRHVQPLYKMFVKAFYKRSDVAAARKVVGIIKALEIQGRKSSGMRS